MANFSNLVSVKRDIYRKSKQDSKESEDNKHTLVISSSPPPIVYGKDKSCVTQSTNLHTYIILLCYLGALIQGATIFSKYLKYPTTNTVYIERPSETELPSISLCFFYSLDEFQNVTVIDGVEHYPLKLSEINERLPKIEDWILDCKVLNNNSYQYEPCLNLWNYYVEYLSLYSKCYSYFESLMPQIYYKSQFVMGKWMMEVKFNISVIKSKRIGIYITHTYAELEESLGNPSFLQFDTVENNQAGVTFQNTVVERLPPPYNTSCRYYEHEPCNHPKTCTRHCVMNMSYDNYHSWFSRSYVKLRPEFMDGHFTNRSEKEMFKNCSETYSEQPCHDYYYLAILTSAFKSEILENDTFQLSMAYPIAPKTQVVFQPASKLMDTLCLFGGQFYLWTSISLLCVISLLSWKFKKFFKNVSNDVMLKRNSKLSHNLKTCISNTQLRPKVSVISKAAEDDAKFKTVRLNKFTSHGLSTLMPPEG
ncbi:uncharacterized protein LOC107365594 [Tetranychus urticae]|uniref:Uncharacterized protein n=1 Tax=Tetranychus urticae TaxID=32264 RepID=T1KMY2_TETUR|nr:uncharacterized protein LOC107365594 [Tetranychus urticae]XP_025017257.1 uncharacterized protein LOC107365594 [Tetranychus urticae]